MCVLSDAQKRESLGITPPIVAYDANSKWCLKNYYCVCHRQRPCVCEAACKGDELILLLCIFCLLPKGILQRCLHAVACEAWCLFFVMGPIFFELHLHTAEGLIWISFCGQLLSWLLVEMSFICVKSLVSFLKKRGLNFVLFASCISSDFHVGERGIPSSGWTELQSQHSQSWACKANKESISCYFRASSKGNKAARKLCYYICC